jgi:hypothetical protein
MCNSQYKIEDCLRATTANGGAIPMTAVGDILKRKRGDGPKEIRIIGIRDGQYIAEFAEAFEAPFEIAPHELAAQYAGDPDPVTQVDENAAWQSMDKTWLNEAARQAAAAENAAPPALTPEQSLALQAKDA